MIYKLTLAIQHPLACSHVSCWYHTQYIQGGQNNRNPLQSKTAQNITAMNTAFVVMRLNVVCQRPADSSILTPLLVKFL